MCDGIYTLMRKAHPEEKKGRQTQKQHVEKNRAKSNNNCYRYPEGFARNTGRACSTTPPIPA